jgi:hypothetical protein
MVMDDTLQTRSGYCVKHFGSIYKHHDRAALQLTRKIDTKTTTEAKISLSWNPTTVTIITLTRLVDSCCTSFSG